MHRPSKVAAVGLLAAGLLSLSPVTAAAQDFINPPAGYRLDLDRAKVCHAAMMAVMKAAKTDDALRAELTSSDVEFTPDMDAVVAEWKRIAPIAARRMDASDCDTRSYWIGTLVMIQSMAFVAAMEEVPELAKEMPGMLTPDLTANLEIYKADRPTYEVILTELMAAEADLTGGP